MNSKDRIYSLLLCLLLAVSPLAGMAEDMEIAPDSALPPAAEEAAQSMPEAVDAAIDLPVIEAETEIPAPAEEAVAEDIILPELTPPPAAIEIDEITGVASGANYSQGYARLAGPAAGYSSASPDAEAVIYLEQGVFFVSARRASASSDRLRVHFDVGGETCSVWVDERSLRPMSADEVLSFVTAQLNKASARLYGGDPMLPLDTPSYSSVITYSAAKQEKNPAAPAMFVSQTQILLAVGESQPIGVSFSDGKGHAVSFMCEDEAIACVSGDGRVTGVSAGSTRVQLKSEFSNLAVIEIQVQE